MTLKEAIEVLKKDRDLCLFNPTTGECEPMNEDCRQSAEALDIAINALENIRLIRFNAAVIDKLLTELEGE